MVNLVKNELVIIKKRRNGKKRKGNMEDLLSNSLMGRIWYPYWDVGFDPTNPMPGHTTL